jgi:ribonucleoside-diphosphate reductase alpha chain
VQRYIDFFKGRFPKLADEIQELYSPIYELKVMPSMRALMTAGKALSKDEVAGYNCSFIAIDNPRAFDEALYILMCGVGVGFSVERQFISKMPEVAEEFHDSATVLSVRDSKIGWATSFRELISLLYVGQIPKWDMSKIRPHGAKLKTMGGRASGPEPLERLFQFTIGIFKKAAGRRLSSIECHDLMCMIGEIVVMGGVRRSALLSLSNLSDDRMRLAKSGQWWVDTAHRQLANNSAAYTERPDFEVFLNEWNSLYSSKSGERGIFNRQSAQKQAYKRGLRSDNISYGTNPCGEIILRPEEFCNLSEVVVRADDTLETLKVKVILATILGTLQSSLTNFRYIRKVWKENVEEERLLGVSLTGISDNPLTGDHSNPELPALLEALKKQAIETNKIWAKKLGITPSAAITTVKPSGTVSQLTDSASGIHPRFSKYYIRRVRADKKDPLAAMMQLYEFPCEDDKFNQGACVFSFPIEAPDHAKLASSETAMDQLKLWKIYHDHWCDHNPSITVYYRDHEFLEVGNWVWNNFDSISGIAFLPYSDHNYVQAPYEAISKEKYEELLAQMPKNVDWSELANFETDDNTAGSQTLSCSAGVCEVVDLVQS